jgi:uncharacterized protein YukE
VGDEPKTFEEFKVDLKQLHNAIGSVRREHTAITDAMSAVGTEFGAVETAWGTPATTTFDDVQSWFVKVSKDLEDLLDDMVNRLQTAYNNYKHTEETNTQNLKPHGDHSSTHHKDSGPPGNHGADRHVVTHDDATATLRDGMTDPTPLQDQVAATPREAALPAHADMPAATLRDRASSPLNSG